MSYDYSEIYSDGHCVIEDNAIGYSRITDKNGRCLMHEVEPLQGYHFTQIQTPIGTVKCAAVRSEDTPMQQIQYAEIVSLNLALIVGLKYHTRIIYTDSTTANAWSSGKIKAHIKDSVKLSFCLEAQVKRKEFESKGGVVKLIDGKENLSDFGWHCRKLLMMHMNLNIANTTNPINLSSVITETKEEIPDILDKFEFLEICMESYKKYYENKMLGNPLETIGQIISSYKN